MKWLRRASLLLLALPLAACWRPAQIQTVATEAFQPLPPAIWACGFTALQRLRSERGEGTRSLNVMLQVQPEGLRLVGLNNLGLRLFELTQDTSGAVQMSSRVDLPAGFDPAWVLRDLQFVAAPEAALRAALQPGWALDVEAGQRRLSRAGELVLQATHAPAGIWAGETALWNHQHAYRLAIQTLQYRPAAETDCAATERSHD